LAFNEENFALTELRRPSFFGSRRAGKPIFDEQVG
jgi:hypothetical protein